MYITEGLIIHFMVISTLVVIIILQLHRQHLFNWHSAGFWAWCAIMLYFVITPAIQELGGNRYYLDTRLSLTEGLPRMLWVTLCVAVGIALFYLAYFLTKPGSPNFGLPQKTWPRGTWIIIILCLLGAWYSLSTFRGITGSESSESVTIVGGKFVGETTGYATVMHNFASIPIILLLFRRSTMVLGLVILGIYLGARLEDVSDRATAVSLMLAISVFSTYRRNRRWPSFWLVGVLLFFTLLIHVRGHQTMTRFVERGQGEQAVQLSEEEVKRGEGASMLASLYLKTYMQEKVGYTYGLHIASGVLFGWLPRKYFPWKDWIMEDYVHGADIDKIYGSEMTFGSKNTVIGDLYGAGGIMGIILGMPLLGFLTRKLDGFLSPQAPLAVRAAGSIWVGSYWMMFGSAINWAFSCFYLAGIPFIAIVLMAKIATPDTENARVKQISLKSPGSALLR
jgi:hypothetical protein